MYITEGIVNVYFEKNMCDSQNIHLGNGAYDYVMAKEDGS